MDTFNKTKIDKLIEETRARRMDKELAAFFAQYDDKPDLLKDFSEYVSWIKNVQIKKRPSRSNLKQLGLESTLDERFCDETHMYLLRGDYKNCDSGFYTYQYAFGEQTIEQLCKNYTIEEIYYYITCKIPREPLTMTKPELLAIRQTSSGGSCFVSTTTNYEAANNFAFCKKGNIYIVKIKKEDVLKALGKVTVAYEESEYLVPDFISDEEIVASFDYTDYIGVKDYLNNIAHLQLSDKDLIPSVYVENNEWSYNELASIGTNLPPFIGKK